MGPVTIVSPHLHPIGGNQHSNTRSIVQLITAPRLPYVLRRSLESLTLGQGDRRDEEAYRRVQAGSGFARECSLLGRFLPVCF